MRSSCEACGTSCTTCREPLNERRAQIISKVYNVMDQDQSGKVTVADIGTPRSDRAEKTYSVESHKDFIAGKKTKAELLQEFLSGFEGLQGNKDGVITKEEFFDYYTDLSMVIASDDYFIAMIESAWMIGENEEDLVFKERLNTLIATVRLKLQSLAKTQDEYLLRNIFKEFDVNRNGCLTVDELQAMLYKLGIAVERKYLMALFRKFDVNKSGVIEFEEFCTFLTYNPYTK